MQGKGLIALGGVGNIVANEIAEKTGAETRAVVLGHVQRGGSPTSYDRLLATKYGTMAAMLACTGKKETLFVLTH